MEPLSQEEVASRASVEVEYVRRVEELGGLESWGDRCGEGDVHRVALLHAWEAAGLSPGSILTAVRQGELSFSFLDTPGWALPARPDLSYRELSKKQGVPLSLVLGLHEEIGFQPPSPDERVRQDDLVMVDLARATPETGASEAAVRRMFRLYADNLRRLATAEAELYQAEVQTRLRQEGIEEADLMGPGRSSDSGSPPWCDERCWGSMSGTGSTCGPRTRSLSRKPRSSGPVYTRASRGLRPSASLT